MVLGYVRFKVATQHRKYKCFQLLLSSRVASNHAICRLFCGGKGFSALGGFKVAQNDSTYTGSCGFLAQNPVNWDGFKLCTLQSGHKTPSTPPWRGSLSTATKHRQYQCFQLLQFARVASNHAMDRVFCGCPAKNLVKADGFSSNMVEKYLVLRKVPRLQYLVLCLNFDPLARASVQRGGSSRVTPDSLLPFVHPFLSQVCINSSSSFKGC